MATPGKVLPPSPPPYRRPTPPRPNDISLLLQPLSAKVELAELIATELGIRVPFRLADIDEVLRDVKLAVKAKKRRLQLSWKTRRAHCRAGKLGYVSRSVATSSYQGG